jgi:hypothetical protein
LSRAAYPLAWHRIAAWVVDWLIISAYAVALVPLVGTGRTPYDHAAATRVVRSPPFERSVATGKGTPYRG